MSAHRGPRLWYASLAIGIAMLLMPGSASASLPVCDGGPFLYDLPAGQTHVNPRAPCTDADGDPITIEVRTPPHLGTLSPAGTIPIGEIRFYTANADAGNLPAPRDTMTFVAHAGGEESTPVTVDVRIKPPDHAPVCDDLAVAVTSGHSAQIPAPHCVDPDNGAPKVIFDKPAHGTYDVNTRRYTPKPGFTGKDTMTFAAVDYWHVSSEVGRITVSVGPGSGSGTTPTSPGSPDRRAPSLHINAPSSLELGAALRRGILFTARTNEAGRLAVKLYVGRKTARRFRLGKHPMDRVGVGKAARHIVAGKTVVRVKFSRKARARLKQAATVRLTLVVNLSDAAGNVRAKRVRIVLVGKSARRA
jgi:Bacterial Ig domain